MLELPVLFLQRAQPFRLVHLHSAKLPLPAVEAPLRDAVPPARADGDYEQERSAALNQPAGVVPVPVALHPQQQSTCVVIQTNQQMAANKECPSDAQSATSKTIGESWPAASTVKSDPGSGKDTPL